MQFNEKAAEFIDNEAIVVDLMQVRNRRYEELDAAQRKKMRQLSLLELTVLFDQHRLDAGRKRRIPRKVKVHHNSDGALYGVQLSQLVDKDRRIKAATKTPFVMDTVSFFFTNRMFSSN